MDTLNNIYQLHKNFEKIHLLVKQNKITKSEAVLRITPTMLEEMLHPQIDPVAKHSAIYENRLLASGMPSAPGAATGILAIRRETALQYISAHQPYILCLDKTIASDIELINNAQAVISLQGGTTGHLTVISRQLGKPCITGLQSTDLDSDSGVLISKNTKTSEGKYVTVDGSTGNLYQGLLELVEPLYFHSDIVQEILSWTDDIRKLKIYGNADDAPDIQRALTLGANGIGVCRTEHMFLNKERLELMRQILTFQTNATDVSNILAKLANIQKQDFVDIFEVLKGQVIAIRLLDAPMHEFLPLEDSEREVNPMLGLRGIRMGILHTGIYRAQIKAIFEAAFETLKKGQAVNVGIMLPMVSTPEELVWSKILLEDVAREFFILHQIEIPYRLGVMIEVPRAALISERLAEMVQFFAYGTNDLTQTTYGISRDDAEGKFLSYYMDNSLMVENPFQVLDIEGVGSLIKTSLKLGKKSKPSLIAGICGEHGAHPSAISFSQQIGLDYVSCSSPRIPLARLSAAHAAILSVDQ